MILSPKQIQELLKKTFPRIRFLETVSATTGRFRSKSIIVFEYTNIAGESLVLKFFSLQKLEEDTKALEKADLLDEFRRIKSFGSHPNMVRVYDANELWRDDELIGFYITMEKFSNTLAGLIRQEYRFSEKEVMNFLTQMDSILTQAHYKLSEPIVHSDIKPDNIGIREREDGSKEYALMDFDISSSLERKVNDEMSFTLSNKALMRGVSPAYAPPEQVMAYIHKTGEISNRVDVYAVGAVAMEMMTGIRPKKEEGMMYYDLPFRKVRGKWKLIFESLCNPDPKKRARKISEALAIGEDKPSDKSPVITEGFDPVSIKVEQGSLDEEIEPGLFNVHSGLGTPYEEPPDDDIYEEDQAFAESNKNMWAVVVIVLIVIGAGLYYWMTDSSDPDVPFDSPAVTEQLPADPPLPSTPGDTVQPYSEVYSIGDRGPAGGIVFYDKGVFSEGWRYLEAAPAGWSGASDDPRAPWGCRGIDIRGTGRETGYGQMNSQIIVRDCQEAGHAAAIVSVYERVHGGTRFNDWFVPSRSELNLMYRNLHQNNLGGFSSSLYWTSSQVNSGFAWNQNFTNGSQTTDFKSDERRIRPVRSF